MYIFLLVITTFIWGTGFLATRYTFEAYSPVWSNAWRFIFVALLCLPFLVAKRKLVHLKDSVILGSLLCAGLILQTIGIKYTSLMKAGFFTNFHTLFTPIILTSITGRKFKKSFWLCIFIALLGMGFLCNLEINDFNYGDLLILLSAFFFSLHIILLEKRSHRSNPLILNFSQSIVIAIISLFYALALEGFSTLDPLIPGSEVYNFKVLLGFIILCIFSSIIAFSLQIFAQRKIRAEIVGLIFLMEAIFAAMWGFIALNEALTTYVIIGATLILFALIFSIKTSGK